MTADRFNSRAPSSHHDARRDGGSPSAPGRTGGRESASARRPKVAQARAALLEQTQQAQQTQQPDAPRLAAQSGLQQVSALHMLIALLVPPLAWLAQVSIAEMVLGQRCVVGAPLFVVHAMAWTPFTVAAASVVCVIFGVFGTFVAWRNLWRTARIPWRFPAALKGTRAERDWFLSRLCAMSSTMFLLGLVATEVAMLMIAPCSPW
jgi:hypothetical protein